MPVPIKLLKEYYTPELLRLNPDTLFVFGDNLHRYGKGGQAIIRDEPNAFGIATKAKPSQLENSFFRPTAPTHFSAMLDDINTLTKVIHWHQPEYTSVVLPYAGLGTGLSELPQRCPEFYKTLVKLVYQDNGAEYEHLLKDLT